MKYKLKVIYGKNNDFDKIKKDGFSGVIFIKDLCNFENLKEAKKRKLKIFIYIRDLERADCLYLDKSGIKDAELYAVMLKTVKSTVKKLDKKINLIDGFVIPTPITKGLLWNDAFPILYEDFCGGDIREELPLIFDRHAENVSFRVWYYNMAERVLFLDYILPIFQYLASLGKKACFDFGSTDKGIELIKKQLNPLWFKKKKIPVIYETEEGITLLYGNDAQKPNLLVLPMRSIMLNYAYGEKYSRCETPFVLAKASEEYYKSSVKKCRIECEIVDERAFSNIKAGKLKKYENILICDACALSAEDKDRITKLKTIGVRVNEKKFLDMIDRVH